METIPVTDQQVLDELHGLDPKKWGEVINFIGYLKYRSRGNDDKLIAQDACMTNSTSQNLSAYEAKTPLGKRLTRIRARIVAAGQPLLDWEGIEAEIAERRGGPNGIDALHVAAAASLQAEELITSERPEKPIHRTARIRVITIWSGEQSR